MTQNLWMGICDGLGIEIQRMHIGSKHLFFPSPQIWVDTGLALLAWICYGNPQQYARLSAYVGFKSPKTVIRDHDWNWHVISHESSPTHRGHPKDWIHNHFI